MPRTSYAIEVYTKYDRTAFYSEKSGSVPSKTDNRPGADDRQPRPPFSKFMIGI
jgi:hypothetical protein